MIINYFTKEYFYNETKFFGLCRCAGVMAGMILQQEADQREQSGK
jgi:hypothetical protein